MDIVKLGLEYEILKGLTNLCIIYRQVYKRLPDCGRRVYSPEAVS